MTGRRLSWLIQTAFTGLYLNLIWLAASLPVVTAPAATGALVKSVRDWQNEGQRPTARSFLRSVREVGGPSTVIGTVAVAVVALAGTNALIAGQFGVGRRVFLGLMFAVLLNALVLTVFSLPQLAAGRSGARASVASSARLAVSAPLPASAAGLTLLAGGVVAVIYPVTLLFVPVIVAGVLEALRRRAVAGREPAPMAHPIEEC